MLINEVANAYEDENVKKNDDQEKLMHEKDKVIEQKLREIQDLQNMIQEKELDIRNEKEAYARLHEAYLIMQHHNEESLAMRL